MAGGAKVEIIGRNRCNDNEVAVTDKKLHVNASGSSLAVSGTVTVSNPSVQYAEDTPHVSGDMLNMAGAVQKFFDSSLALEGDRSVLQVDGQGFLKVNDRQIGHTPFNAALKQCVAIGAVRDDVGPLTATEGTVNPVRMTGLKALHVNLRDTLGNEIGDAAGNPVVVRQSNGSAFIDVRGGDVAHDSIDAGNPVKIGHQAVEFFADPPQVSADSDRVNSIATPQGMQLVLGGHPNIIVKEFATDDTEAATDILGAVPAGSHVVVVGYSVSLGHAATGSPRCEVGFGDAAVPAGSVGMLFAHGGIPPGFFTTMGNGGGILAVGGDGQELRINLFPAHNSTFTIIIHYYISTL